MSETDRMCDQLTCKGSDSNSLVLVRLDGDDSYMCHPCYLREQAWRAENNQTPLRSWDELVNGPTLSPEDADDDEDDWWPAQPI